MENRTGDIFPECTQQVPPLLYTLSLSHALTAYCHFVSVSTLLSYQGMKKGARSEVKKMGPLKVAHLNGLSVSRQPMHDEIKDEPERASNDERVGHLSFYFASWNIFVKQKQI